jgi:hypothetical protein
MVTRREPADLVLSRADMLNIDQFADLCCSTRAEIRRKAKRRELISIEGSYFGARYPAWQLDASGAPLRGIKELYSVFQGDSWLVYDYLTEPNPLLSGVTPLELLAGGSLEAVLSAAKSSPPQPRRKR